MSTHIYHFHQNEERSITISWLKLLSFWAYIQCLALHRKEAAVIYPTTLPFLQMLWIYTPVSWVFLTTHFWVPHWWFCLSYGWKPSTKNRWQQPFTGKQKRDNTWLLCIFCTFSLELCFWCYLANESCIHSTYFVGYLKSALVQDDKSWWVFF